jgi:hypothetical protein
VASSRLNVCTCFCGLLSHVRFILNQRAIECVCVGRCLLGLLLGLLLLPVRVLVLVRVRCVDGIWLERHRKRKRKAREDRVEQLWGRGVRSFTARAIQIEEKQTTWAAAAPRWDTCRPTLTLTVRFRSRHGVGD